MDESLILRQTHEFITDEETKQQVLHSVNPIIWIGEKERSILVQNGHLFYQDGTHAELRDNLWAIDTMLKLEEDNIKRGKKTIKDQTGFDVFKAAENIVEMARVIENPSAKAKQQEQLDVNYEMPEGYTSSEVKQQEQYEVPEGYTSLEVKQQPGTCEGSIESYQSESVEVLERPKKKRGRKPKFSLETSAEIANGI